jgi:hypothetical protein
MPTVAVQGAQDFSYHQLEQKYKKRSELLVTSGFFGV